MKRQLENPLQGKPKIQLNIEQKTYTKQLWRSEDLRVLVGIQLLETTILLNRITR